MMHRTVGTLVCVPFRADNELGIEGKSRNGFRLISNICISDISCAMGTFPILNLLHRAVGTHTIN